MSGRNENNSFIAIISLFVFWPFLAIISYLKEYKSLSFANVFWCFFCFLGFVIVLSDQGADAYRYSEFYKEFASLDIENKSSFFNKDEELDIFRKASFWFVSYFTKDPRFYFLFIGLVFGYYYSRLFFEIVNSFKTKILSISSIIILINFLFVCNFYSYQFVRSSTSFIIFIYYLYRYIKTENKLYLIGTTISIFVHFTMFFPCVLALLYFFIPKRLYYFYFFFLLTSLIDWNIFPIAKYLQLYVDFDSFGSRTGYLDEEYKMETLGNKLTANWYILIKNGMAKYVNIIVLYLVIFDSNKTIFIKFNYYTNLLMFAMYFGSIFNIFIVIPSFDRFLFISNSLIWIAFIIKYITDFTLIKNNIIFKIIYLLSIFNIIIGFRYAMDILSIDVFISNPILAYFFTTDISLIYYIKGSL